MRAHKNYLISLDRAPSIRPQNGSQATIYDWPGGDSFQVINVVSAESDWRPAAHILAIVNNSFGATNFQGSRLRYRDANNTLETRAIVSITALDE